MKYKEKLCSDIKHLNLDNNFVMTIPMICKKKLETSFAEKVRLSESKINFKISILKMSLLKRINDNEFSNRFQNLVSLGRVLDEFKEEQHI